MDIHPIDNTKPVMIITFINHIIILEAIHSLGKKPHCCDDPKRSMRAEVAVGTELRNLLR